MSASIRKAIAGIILWTLPGLAFATGALENPQPGSTQTGIGLISGWDCRATQVSIQIDGAAPIPAAYGTPRGDTASVCGQSNTGFGLLINFNLYGPGSHTIVAFADGVEFGSATFNVVTLGQEFLTGAAGMVTVPGFPNASQQVTLQWQESRQNFSIVGAAPAGGSGSLDGTYRLARATIDYLGGSLLDTAAGTLTASGTMVLAGNQVTQSISATINGATISLSISGTFTDFGAYAVFVQNGVSKRAPILIRSPVLATETINAALNAAPPYTEVDQWARVSAAKDAAALAGVSPVTPGALAPPFGGAIGAALMEASKRN